MAREMGAWWESLELTLKLVYMHGKAISLKQAIIESQIYVYRRKTN